MAAEADLTCVKFSRAALRPRRALQDPADFHLNFFLFFVFFFVCLFVLNHEAAARFLS